jgi:hypothetical protein
MRLIGWTIRSEQDFEFFFARDERDRNLSSTGLLDQP